MAMHKLKFLGIFILTLLLTNCSNDDENISNPLVELGLIGDWEINGRGINNISSLEALCCETLNFSDDENTRDWRGLYRFNDSSGIVIIGSFNLNDEDGIIEFMTENNTTNSLEYNLNDNVLEVWHFDDEGGRHWTTYIKL